MTTTELLNLPGRRFLLHLTTQRAFWLFLVFFVLGVVSIIVGIGLPWTPALLVLVYGGCLLYSASRLHVSHSETTNNSPYFLGFVFFLVSLFRSFYSVSFSSGNEIDTVIHQLGAALLTTIVGLPIRQALYAFSPSQADQDLFYRTLEEELRRSAAEFRRAQVEMLEIIQEFVLARQTLFKDEQKSMHHYVTSLKRATAILDGSFNRFPDTLATLLDTSLIKFRALDDQLQRLTVATSGVDTNALRLSFESLQNIGAGIKELDLSVGSLQATFLAVRSSADTIPQDLRRQVADLGEQLAVIPQSFQKQVTGLGEQLAAIPRAVHQQVEVIRNDIKQIDALLDTFVVLLQKKIEAVK